MSFKLHLILAWKLFMQIRCNFPDISYFSETQKNNIQFLSNSWYQRFSCLSEVGARGPCLSEVWARGLLNLGK